jgi:hypothetical protein
VLCPGTGSSGGHGCVVGCGASHGVIAIGVWVGVGAVIVVGWGWGSVMWGLGGGGVRGSMVGARERRTVRVSLLWGFPCRL